MQIPATPRLRADPRTGVGLTDHSLVVVIAKDCQTANSVSTSSGVLGPKRALKFAAAKGACVRIVRKPHEQIEVRQSPCFARFLVR